MRMCGMSCDAERLVIFRVTSVGLLRTKRNLYWQGKYDSKSEMNANRMLFVGISIASVS